MFEVLAANSGVPLNEALIEWSPTGSNEVSNDATPDGSTLSVCSTSSPSLNVTEPPFTALPAASVTVATNVTDSPTRVEAGDAVRTVPVAASAAVAVAGSVVVVVGGVVEVVVVGTAAGGRLPVATALPATSDPAPTAISPSKTDERWWRFTDRPIHELLAVAANP